MKKTGILIIKLKTYLANLRQRSMTALAVLILLSGSAYGSEVNARAAPIQAASLVVSTDGDDLPGQKGVDYPPLTHRHMAVILIDFPDTAEAIKTEFFPTPEEMANWLFNDRIAEYFTDMSYGQFTMTGEVFGYFTHQDPGYVDGQIYTKAQLEAINSITIPGFDINDWDGIVLVPVHDKGFTGPVAGFITIDINGEEVNTRGSVAPFQAGGTSDYMSNPTTFSIPTGTDTVVSGNSTIDFNNFERFFAHEFVHYLGVSWHANTRTNGAFFDYLPEQPGNSTGNPPTSLLDLPYGNQYDVMAQGEYGMSLNSVFRDWLGWTNPGNRHSIKAYGQSTVTIFPINRASGIRSVEIRLPFQYAPFEPRKNQGYFLEVRSAANEWNNMLLHPELTGNQHGIMVLKTDGADSRLLDMSPSPNIMAQGRNQPDIRDVVLKPGMVYENPEIRLSNVVDYGDGSFGVDVEVKVVSDISLQAVATPDTVPESGDNVTFAVNITNVGSAHANLTALTHMNGLPLHGTGSCTLPRLIPAGGNYACAFVDGVTGKPGDPFTDTFVGTVDGAPYSDMVQVSFTDNLPSIEVSVSPAVGVLDAPGGPVSFTVSVRNRSGTGDWLALTGLTNDVFGELNGMGDCALPQAIAPGDSYDCAFIGNVSGASGEMVGNTTTATGRDDEANEVQDDGLAVVLIRGGPCSECQLFTVFVNYGQNDRSCVGDGQGGFDCKSISPATGISKGVALGLVDGDEHLDAVIAVGNSNRDQLCLGNGTGGFTCDDLDSAFTTASGVALGHVNGDAYLDAVFANTNEFSSGQNRVCLGDGAGTFTCSNISESKADSPGLALGFVDGDQYLDAVFANTGVDNKVCLGNGEGGFNCSDMAGVTGTSSGVALGDLDGDGALDAVFSVSNFNQERVCLGDGDGGFSCSNLDNELHDARAVALGKFDEDQHLDALFALGGQDIPNKICPGDGDGGFETCYYTTTSRDTRALALGLINQDEHLDVIYANYNADNRVCLGSGTGAFLECIDIANAPFSTLGVAVGTLAPIVIFSNSFEGDPEF